MVPVQCGPLWVWSVRMYDKELALDPTPESVRISRELVRSTLDSMDTDLVEVAAILTDEMVTNAVKHGRPPISLAIEGDNEGIVISVADGGPGFPVARAVDRTAENGRGLVIIDVLSDEWGVVPLYQGKQVWCRLHVRDARVDAGELGKASR
jgi:anti-sigma regulatory factor (Ser/Thr protein kinase)